MSISVAVTLKEEPTELLSHLPVGEWFRRVKDNVLGYKVTPSKVILLDSAYSVVLVGEVGIGEVRRIPPGSVISLAIDI